MTNRTIIQNICILSSNIPDLFRPFRDTPEYQKLFRSIVIFFHSKNIFTVYETLKNIKNVNCSSMRRISIFFFKLKCNIKTRKNINEWNDDFIASIKASSVFDLVILTQQFFKLCYLKVKN